MSNYIISFRNGHKMKVSLEDGNKFISDLTAGLSSRPQAVNHYYLEPGIIICTSDISACHPEDMEYISNTH